MFLSRSQVHALLARALCSGQLPETGPTSLFIRPMQGTFIRRPAQLALVISEETITVRTSRLPFSKPLVFTRNELSKEQR